MSKKDRDTLGDAVARVIEINHLVVSIEPDFIARNAMEIIGFKAKTHPAGWYGCYQHLLALSRDQLRAKFDPTAQVATTLSGQDDFFPETLQRRYPERRARLPDGSAAPPVYTLRENLSEDDRWYNVDRFAQASAALLRHRNALEAETIQLFGKRKRVA